MAHKKSPKETFNEIIQILKYLNDEFPSQNILRHIADATAEYGNIWGVENKEFLFALEKYKAEMYLPDEDEINRIIEDGKKLDKIGKKDEDLDENLEDLEENW